MSKQHVLKMYKLLLQESKKFQSYNYRNYALRKIKDSFKENKGVQDSGVVMKQLDEAARNLEIIKRQATIGHLYSSEKLVIENLKKST